MAKVVLDSSTRLDIVCRRGDTFGLSIDFGQDMSSHGTFNMDVRRSEYHDAIDTGVTGYVIQMEFDDLTNDNKTLYIKKSADTMKNVASGVYVYDLQTLSDSGVVKTWLYGTFTVREDITVNS